MEDVTVSRFLPSTVAIMLNTSPLPVKMSPAARLVTFSAISNSPAASEIEYSLRT